jgi:lysophospholipase L1-like esterase
MRHRAGLLNLLALSIGLAAVGAVEGVLRVFHIGPSSRLFLLTEDEGQAVYAINPEVAHRFFQPQYLRHVPFDSRFAATKSRDTVRIFALGASTLVGFPNPPSTSFTHFLERMLADVFPGRHFEVVNCGITALSSFCLLDFAEEILDYQPDLLLIYSGHNEFVGPYGATTPFVYFGGNRAVVRSLMFLQRTRIYSVLRQLGYQIQQWLGNDESGARFGLHLVSREIDILDPSYRSTGENYRRNLQTIVAAAGGRNVSVLLSTLVSNTGDFYPLRSACSDRIEDPYTAAGEATRAERLKAALSASPYCAALQFESGMHYFGRGQYEKAHQAFVRARDMDRFPFRAPTYFNQIIRNLAAEEETVLLSDTEAVFAEHSPHGIIGSELITEHLHPTVYGHYLIARNMVEVLAANPASRTWGPGALERLKTYEESAPQLDYTLEDRVYGRNDLIFFLKQMPYEHPPPTLRRRIAELMHQQVRDCRLLPPEAAEAFRAKGGDRFLWKMLDFLLPADRQGLRQRFAAVFGVQ